MRLLSVRAVFPLPAQLLLLANDSRFSQVESVQDLPKKQVTRELSEHLSWIGNLVKQGRQG
jgi:hypothetical protein